MPKINNLSAEDTNLIHQLSHKLDITFAKRLAKGHEKKFYVETSNGEKRLLRINDMQYYDWLEGDFRMYGYVAASSIHVSKPICMGSFHEGTLAYQLYTWLDGEDLIAALSRMGQEEQFLTGIKSGALMKKLHTLFPENEADP